MVSDSEQMKATLATAMAEFSRRERAAAASNEFKSSASAHGSAWLASRYCECMALDVWYNRFLHANHLSSLHRHRPRTKVLAHFVDNLFGLSPADCFYYWQMLARFYKDVQSGSTGFCTKR